MFEVSVEETFAAGHALRNYHGKCENVHGHNYRVRVVLEGAELDHAGLLVDFTEIKRVLRAIIEKLDHQFLNDVAPFDKLNPSAENMARYFYQEISGNLAVEREHPVRVAEVKIWETDTATATYRLP
ncbi:MAG TPA: 6-carboxytetrahydropterin synthase QueD [Bryobacteraceae bacterium]|nr:6-carboxytetrahydropterin synthase QueD [Bryobacteraceae bacterium]